MNKTAALAGVAMAALASSGFAQPTGEIALRIVTAPDFDGANAQIPGTGGDLGPIEVAPGTMVSQDFYVQALIVGDMDATGLVTFDGTLVDGSTSNFTPAPLYLSEIGLPFPGLDLNGLAGMFPSYLATIGDNNGDLGNGASAGDGMPGDPFRWTFLPLNISATGNGEAIGGVWADIYKFNWTGTVDATVTLDIGAEFGGYQATAGLQQPALIQEGSFTYLIPAPGAAALFGMGGLFVARRRR